MNLKIEDRSDVYGPDFKAEVDLYETLRGCGETEKDALKDVLYYLKCEIQGVIEGLESILDEIKARK